jgi:N-acetylglucosaminyldiphosphoundecaprenol N-acetyl-beta-D-mannosaminyltransferase
MYLRYGDPTWDAADPVDAPLSSPQSSSTATKATAARRDEHGALAAALNRLTARSGRYPSVTLAGVRLDAITEKQCIAHVLDELDAGRGGMLVTPNLDHLHRCRTNLAFTALVAEADLVVADGMPLVWASRLQGTPLPERVAGSNLISTLSGAAAQRGRTIYLLGGAEGTADGAAKVLTERFPGLKIAGTYYPPMGFENDAHVMGDIVASLSTAKPDIVYVALGSPKQEKLIARLRPIVPEAWWVGVGNSFSFLCGDVKRAPKWMQVSGLEWVHRLCQEPKRLFKRYVMVGVPFAGSLLAKSTVKGIPTRLSRVLPKRKRKIAPIATPRPAQPIAPAPVNGNEPVSTSVSLIVDPVHVETPKSEPRIASADSESRATSSLARLRALILLGGSVRPSALTLTSGRSILDLPLDENGTILAHWTRGAAELAKSVGLESLPVRVMVNQNSPEPASVGAEQYGAFRVERDASEFRGTGGVLRDLATDYGDDDLILVANAAQILLDPLPSIVAAMTRKPGDVSIVSHDDGTPSGLMLITCKTLRSIADTGYVDMKEQALPKIAQQFDVRVVRRRRPCGLPVRSLEDYVQALRLHHRRRQGKPFIADPLAEDWSPSFALIETGSTVDSTARVHDAIVLSGGVVEPGAVLVRSIVCSGEVVRRDKTIVDQVVCTDDGRARRVMQHGFEVIQKTVSAAAAV